MPFRFISFHVAWFGKHLKPFYFTKCALCPVRSETEALLHFNSTKWKKISNVLFFCFILAAEILHQLMFECPALLLLLLSLSSIFSSPFFALIRENLIPTVKNVEDMNEARLILSLIHATFIKRFLSQWTEMISLLNSPYSLCTSK